MRKLRLSTAIVGILASLTSCTQPESKLALTLDNIYGPRSRASQAR